MPLGERHGERFLGQRLRERGMHRPAHDAAREEIEHDGQMEPPLARAHRGDVGDPAAIRCGGVKVSLQPVGRGWELGTHGGGPAKLALGARDDAVPTHESSDAVATARDAPLHQVLMNARRAVCLAPARIGRANVDEQRVVALGPARRGSARPGVIAAPRDAQHAAEAPEPEVLAVGRDKVELHFWSSAK